MKSYHGIVVPLITPLDEKERVDEKGLRLLIEHAVCSGIHGLFLAGSNGEGPALTQRERERALQIALDEARDRITVLGGVMDTGTVRVMENLKRYEQMGGKTAVITAPFYARHASEMETIRHFEAAAASTEMDVFVYNIPRFVGYGIKPETLFEISQIEHVVGYKDSSGSNTDFMRVVARFSGTDFSVFQGDTAMMVPGLLAGAVGAVPVLGILFPKLYLGLYQACKSRDYESVKRYNAMLPQAQKILALAPNATCAAKYAISTLGFCSERATWPQVPVTKDEAREIRRQISHVNDLLDQL